jgi:hypothetical protein
LQQPPKYDIQFLYHKQQNKQQTPTFLVTAQRVNKSEDYYEIEISGEKQIKGVMKQFNHEYMTIVDNLRIMGDALVLLNPIKKPTAAGLISHEI